MFAALTGRSLARVRGVLIAVALLVSAFQVAIVLQAATIDSAQSFEMLGRMTPEFLQRWLGDAITTLASFGGLVAIGYFHPVIVLVVSIMTAFIASEPAADAEGGFVDLILARPIARHWLVTRSAVLLMLCPAALAASMMTATWTSVALAAPPSVTGPSMRSIATLAAHLIAVAWCFGALSLALSSFARRRIAAFAPTAIAAVGLYFVNILAASWRPARVADVLSPFHYYQGASVLAGMTDPTRDLLVLGSAATALVAFSYWRFASRDL